MPTASRSRTRSAPSVSIPERSKRQQSATTRWASSKFTSNRVRFSRQRDLQVAAVTAIVGQTRHTLTWTGHANHAGTTPMHLRRDALAGAAEWIVAVEALAQRTDGLVATVGHVDVEPNAGNVIAGAVHVSLDVRHADDAARKSAVEALLAQAEAIAHRRSLALQCTRQMDQPAVPMDERLTAFLAEAIEAAGLPVKLMPSGAGHDAMVMAARVPSGDALSAQPRRPQPPSRRNRARRGCCGCPGSVPQISGAAGRRGRIESGNGFRGGFCLHSTLSISL